MSKLNSRINLQLDVPTCIQVEKESEKRGLTRTQFIRECINEKINNLDKKNVFEDIDDIKTDLKELKTLCIAILDKSN